MSYLRGHPLVTIPTAGPIINVRDFCTNTSNLSSWLVAVRDHVVVTIEVAISFLHIVKIFGASCSIAESDCNIILHIVVPVWRNDELLD